MAEVEIKARENGPLLVKGSFEVIDHDGRAIKVEGESVALCRCGQSAKKPFCDGGHRAAGFDGTCAAESFA